MATNNFKRMTKMQTSEPTADEVGSGMKKGGKTKKMAMGGLPVAAPMARRPMLTRPPMAAPALLQRKNGGESKSEEVREEREIKSVKKDLKKHESEKASKAHHGLKKGGRAVPGALLGGVTDAPNRKKAGTEGVENPGYKNGGVVKNKSAGYKDGGHVAMTCKSQGGFTVKKKMSTY